MNGAGDGAGEPSGLRRRRLLGGLAAVSAGGVWPGDGAWASPAGRWVPAFAAPMHAAEGDDPRYGDAALRFTDLTLRQFVSPVLPGTTWRLRLSNEFGEAPLRIAGAQAGWRAGRQGPVVWPGSSRAVSFGGRTAVRIAAGQTRASDALRLPPRPRDADGRPADLAVTLYLREPTPRASWHLIGARSSFRSPPGNHLRAAVFPVAEAGHSLFFLAAVEVLAPPSTALWVAFGDSITDGNGHTLDTADAWPAQWAAAWAACRGRGAPVGVLNAGVSGNRLLAPLQGLTGLGRFERDVLAVPGAAGAVMLIGINDLSTETSPEAALAMARRLIDGQMRLARQARARGLKVVGATLTPVGGSAYGRPEVEAGRQHLNAWIRSLPPVFDAVVDFDAAVRDPVRPDHFRAGWSVDGLHPGDAGQRAMAEAVVAALGRAGLGPC